MIWKELALTSHYQTAVAIKNELKQRHFEESTTGIEALIDALSRSDKRALRSQLTRLMMHGRRAPFKTTIFSTMG